MKKLFIIIVAVIVSACSSFGSKSPPQMTDQKLATDFTDEGVKIYYTMFGNLERIEVSGQAQAWKGNVEALAEADAMAKLVKFVHGSNVSTDRKTVLIGKAIERAGDQKLDKYKTANGTIDISDRQLEGITEDEQRPSPSAMQSALAVNHTMNETVTTITSSGKLRGIRKIKDYQSNGGKTYVAVYSWSESQQDLADSIRKKMNK